ncbi:DNA cytosine methyltransferase [Streptococcus sobrinus]|uniref:DNA cytosine methyltransferase n=1 Tax=Streptococcus sobrinus TaxID=1310 RepID=UPI000301795B|nr:DNA (cytosine-5-)-methyltransferase [Streptococcus sobrinus]
MYFLDLFSGIGGFRLGMEAVGYTCLGFCEINKFARASYKAIFDTKGEVEFHDIRAVSDESFRRIGRVDIITAGFPCQAFSLAGNRRGFEDTRGTLFFEVARAAAILKPKYLVLENVKGLLNHDRGSTFETILRTLDELGYNVEWQVLNSQNFGVPQNRERVYIIGHLRGRGTRPIFPLGQSSEAVNNLQGQSPRTSTLTAHYPGNQDIGSYIVESRQSQVIPVGNVNPSKRGMNSQVYSVDGLSPTLTTNKGEGSKIIQRGHGFNSGGIHEVAPTLTSNSYQENNFVYENQIRKLTPRECWRLQGFPDWAFNRARQVNSDSQLYKQAGNSVTVNVIKEIASQLEKENNNGM